MSRCEGREISAEHLVIPPNAQIPNTIPSPSIAGRRRRASDLSSENTHLGANNPPSGTTLQEAERDLVERALREVGGNVSKAARRLGISRDQMRYRIDKYALPNDN